MAEVKLQAVARTEFGKGAARRARRAGLVPAVLYGHGTDPVHISLPAHDTLLALRQANALLEIKVGSGRAVLALPKQVQRDPIKGGVEHVDLIIVKRGEKVTVSVPLVVLGADKVDGVVLVAETTLNLEVEATSIPASIEVDVEGLEVGAQITVADLKLPAGAAFAGDADVLVVSIGATPTQISAATSAEEEAEAEIAAEAEAEAEAAAE